MAESLRVDCDVGEYTKIVDDGEFFRVVNLDYPGRFYIGADDPPAVGVTSFIPVSAGNCNLTLDGPLWFCPIPTEGSNVAHVTGVITADAGGGGGGAGVAGSKMALVAATGFARPADTTPYAIGELVANNVTAGSVVPLSFAVSSAAGKSGRVLNATMHKTSTTTALSYFRLHLFAALPAVAGGDNAAFSPSQTDDYLGAIDLALGLAGSDGASGVGVPVIGGSIPVTTDTIYGLLEARAAYVPGSGETITVKLNVDQNL